MAASSTIRVRRDQFLDPRWRLSNLYWITDKAGKAVQFVPNSAQLKFLDEVHTLNLILKARQLGFTTLVLPDLPRCLRVHPPYPRWRHRPQAGGCQGDLPGQDQVPL